MAQTLKLFSFALLTFLLNCSLSHTQCNAQCQTPYAGQNSFGTANGYGSYQPVMANPSVEEMYYQNSQGPLGGLFAKGFTRTLTLMGGANFLNSFEGPSTLPVSGGFAPAGTGYEAETGAALSFAFGRRHSQRLRSEIELAFRDNDITLNPGIAFLPIGPGASEQDTLGAYSVMKNFILDFENSSRFTPYVGAGLGWSYLDLESPRFGIDEGVGAFTYQAIGGVATKLSAATDFVVEYRYLETSEVNLDDIIDIAYRSHNLFLGLKYEY